MDTNELCAIKVVKKAMLTDRKLCELFVTEVKIMAKIWNENVIRLYDYIESASSCYVVTEFCNNGDLQSYL